MQFLVISWWINASEWRVHCKMLGSHVGQQFGRRETLVSCPVLAFFEWTSSISWLMCQDGEAGGCKSWGIYTNTMSNQCQIGAKATLSIIGRINNVDK